MADQSSGTRTRGMGHIKMRLFSFEDLKKYTDDFSEDNLIGKFQFGKVYRGYIGTQEVTVKKWEDPTIYSYFEGNNEARLRDEIILLQHKKMSSHPNLGKLIGYCCEGEEQLGIIYDLNPLDSLRNLVLEDSFTWLQRIKVVLGFSRLLEFMHAQRPPNLPYLIRNIDAAHIMLDKDYNPILFDFGMIIGGILPDKEHHQCVKGCYGYIDMVSVLKGYLTEKIDVFAFGVLLLMLISKRVFTEEDRLDESEVPHVYEWAWDEYNPEANSRWWNTENPNMKSSKCSLVHKSLRVNKGFYSCDGYKITRLAMKCVIYNPFFRPTMEEVVKNLLKLRVIRRHADVLGIRPADRSTETKAFTSA